jgi:hypothetical protein
MVGFLLNDEAERVGKESAVVQLDVGIPYRHLSEKTEKNHGYLNRNSQSRDKIRTQDFPNSKQKTVELGNKCCMSNIRITRITVMITCCVVRTTTTEMG